MRVLILPLLSALYCASPDVTCGPQAADQQPPQAPVQGQMQVEVIGVTPIHGLGLPLHKVPGNVQILRLQESGPRASEELTELLVSRAASVHVSDTQGGSFQPDLLFRGFTASPLLGASEGIAVYQDGVRLNDPFGDTMHWDALPAAAISSVNVMPGSNPLFGLNALGGALSIRTNDGFTFAGHRAAAGIGSFGRRQIDLRSGGHGARIGYFAAAELTAENGWRDHSPSTVRRAFADVAYRGPASTLHLSTTLASNDLTGNGAAPVELLATRRSAVFTHPDRTDNDLALLIARLARQLSSTVTLQGVAYHRRSEIGTFNGDAAEVEEGDGEGMDEGEFDAVNNTSRTRSRGAGVTVQLTRSSPLLHRDNHLVVGGGFDAASTRFAFASELAHLTPARGTVGTGRFDAEAAVRLRTRTATGSVFVTDAWSFTPRLTFSGSARVNWTTVRLRDRIGTALSGDHSFARLNGSAGFTVDAGGGVNVYASYAEASRVPTPVELTCADPEDPCRLPNAFVSDPPLEQVVAGTWEAGIRRRHAAARWALAAFATDARNDIVFVSSGTLRGEGHFENVPRTRRRGLEATFDYAPAGPLAFGAAWTWQDATFASPMRIASRFHPDAIGGEIAVAPGDRLPGIPSQTFKATAHVRAGGRLTIALGARGQSGVYMRGDESNRLPPVPAFVVADMSARYRLAPRVTLVARATNLFDAAFATFGVLGEPSEVLGPGWEDPRFHSPGAPRALALWVEFAY